MKRWIFRGVAVLAVLVVLFVIAKMVIKVELLPEVKAMLEVDVPSDESLKQNMYSALWGLDAPKDVDFIEAGSHMVRQEFTVLQEVIKVRGYGAAKYKPLEHFVAGEMLKPDFKIDGQEYFLPCENLNTANCVDEVLAQKDVLESFLQREDNIILLQRYLAMQKMPELHARFFTVASPLPPFQVLLQMTRLRMMQAIWAFHSGDADRGFQIMQEEVNFGKKMATGDSILIGEMIALKQLAINYMVMNSLMDQPFFEPYLHDPRLDALLKPFTVEEERGKAQAYRNECDPGVYLSFTLKSSDASNSAEKMLLTAFYDHHMTSNVAYIKCEPVIQRASLTLAQVSDLYVSHQLKSLEDLQQEVIDQQFSLKNGSIPFFNYFGEVLLGFSLMACDWAFDRFYSVQIYLSMVSIKHDMLKQGVSKDEVSAYLAKTGARNLYTQEPLQWDASAGRLSTSIAAMDAKNIMRSLFKAEGESELFVEVHFK